MISHDLRPYKRRTALSQSTNFTMANEDSMIDWSDDDEWCHEVDLDPVVQVGGGEQVFYQRYSKSNRSVQSANSKPSLLPTIINL